jgi:hypothetical protein
MNTICFDMDGTLANFYGVEGWLDDLVNSNPRPYAIAKPLFNFSALARQIHRLQAKGYTVNIISWLAKNSTTEFDELVTETKIAWLKKHLPSVTFDNITIVKYGTPKSTCGTGYLFDDEEGNRNEWKGIAYDVNNILDILRSL